VWSGRTPLPVRPWLDVHHIEIEWSEKPKWAARLHWLLTEWIWKGIRLGSTSSKTASPARFPSSPWQTNLTGMYSYTSKLVFWVAANLNRHTMWPCRMRPRVFGSPSIIHSSRALARHRWTTTASRPPPRHHSSLCPCTRPWTRCRTAGCCTCSALQ
jgi:hypothetical protein